MANQDAGDLLPTASLDIDERRQHIVGLSYTVRQLRCRVLSAPIGAKKLKILSEVIRLLGTNR